MSPGDMGMAHGLRFDQSVVILQQPDDQTIRQELFPCHPADTSYHCIDMAPEQENDPHYTLRESGHATDYQRSGHCACTTVFIVFSIFLKDGQNQVIFLKQACMQGRSPLSSACCLCFFKIEDLSRPADAKQHLSSDAGRQI